MLYCYPTEIFYDSEETLNNLQVICPINLGVYNDPVIDEHGHSFCRKCIEECLQAKNKCPYSNLQYSRNNKFIVNLSAKNLIQNLKVKCPNCSFRGTVELYQQHLLNKECKDVNEMNEMHINNNIVNVDNNQNLKKCKYYLQGCNFIGNQFELTKHMQSNQQQHFDNINQLFEEQQTYIQHLEKQFKNQQIKLKQLQVKNNKKNKFWLLQWLYTNINIASWMRKLSYKIIGPINNICEQIDYQGQYRDWMDFIPHGKGMSYYNDQSVYSGNFSFGAKNDKGKIIWLDQSYYYGNFLDDLYHGWGILSNKQEKWIYEGNFEYGHFNGQGKITYKNGITEIGKWVNDMKKGNFVTIYPDGKRCVNRY